MTYISDETMRQLLPTAKEYSLVILKAGPKRYDPGADKILWEHVRRNFTLRADGQLAIVCPVGDASDIRGIGLFTTSLEETKKIMDEDPGVKSDVFVYELHPCNGFPGDCLPK